MMFPMFPTNGSWLSWDSSANMGYSIIMGNPGKSWDIMGYLNASHDGSPKMAIS
jgi:hypothetical protein